MSGLMELVDSRKLESNTYYRMPQFIEYLMEIRDTDHASNINFTIIILSTSLIESVIDDLCALTLEDNFDLATHEGRILQELSESINKANWTGYQRLVKLIFNKGLNEVVNNELWKDICILFDYRNDLVHGNPITVNTFRKNDELVIEYEGRQKKVYNHFIKKGLINLEAPGILTNTIVDYLWKCTKAFATEASLKLKNDKNIIVSLMLSDAFGENI